MPELDFHSFCNIQGVISQTGEYRREFRISRCPWVEYSESRYSLSGSSPSSWKGPFLIAELSPSHLNLDIESYQSIGIKVEPTSLIPKLCQHKLVNDRYRVSITLMRNYDWFSYPTFKIKADFIDSLKNHLLFYWALPGGMLIYNDAKWSY